MIKSIQAMAASRQWGKSATLSAAIAYEQMMEEHGSVKWWLEKNNITPDHMDYYPNARIAYEIKQSKLWKVLG